MADVSYRWCYTLVLVWLTLVIDGVTLWCWSCLCWYRCFNVHLGVYGADGNCRAVGIKHLVIGHCLARFEKMFCSTYFMLWLDMVSAPHKESEFWN